MNKIDPNNIYDVVVIGAGIQGAGIAQAAAAQGWSVLVVERNDVAGAETSSNSSKLIHGGLRYLETAQFGLVYECLAERRLLLRNAPSLVRLVPFYIPIYKGKSFSLSRKPWWIFLGLSFYSLLGGFSKANRFKLIPRAKWPELGLQEDGLLSVFQYFDAQTDDQKLTQAVILSAESMQVEVAYNTELISAKEVAYELNSDHGYSLTLSHDQIVQCKALINAAGPWVNEVAKKVKSAPVEVMDWVQGSHIVLDAPSVGAGEDGCFYFESPIDGRAFFILPWRGKVMVGTTEVPLDAPRAEITEAEVEYLLQNYNEFFPHKLCTKEHVCQTYSGVRVLPHDSSSKNPNKQSRETIFLQEKTENSLYVAVYGGKLTSYRATASKVADMLKPFLGKGRGPIFDTKRIRL